MTTPTLTARPLSQVTSAPARWLLEGYLPRGKLAVLDGDPGVGKSLLALELAARLSRGCSFPDGSSTASRAQVTLFLSGEDGAEDTLRPRAEATGGDLNQMLLVTSTDGPLPRFPADLPRLEELIRACRADLVVIDPVMAFLTPGVAANSDQCVRRVLNTLATLAARTDCTILLVRHLRKQDSKKAIHRGLGSIGILGAVRVGLLAAYYPADPELRVLAVTKANLAKKPPALGFRIVGDDSGRATIRWTEPLSVPADMLGLPMPAPLFPRDRAADWLLRQLAAGPRKATDVLAAAAAFSIPESTLRRARDEANVRVQQVCTDDDERAWYWYDPCAPWPEDAPFEKPFELPPLRPL